MDAVLLDALDLLDTGRNDEEIIDELMKTWGVSHKTAKDTVEEVLRDWT